MNKKKYNRWYLYLIVIAIITILFNLRNIIGCYRLTKFNNLGITVANTIKYNCDKSGCSILYTYYLDGQLYGGNAQNGEQFSCPNKQYYVIYSKNDPTLQVILPNYSTNIIINPDTLNKKYLYERIKCYLKTQTKEDWGWMWNELFEVYEK